jgi:hypothetical protein
MDWIDALFLGESHDKIRELVDMNDLAPIVLFVYARPRHTRQTLEALAANLYADKSLLYIYADGPKPGASELQLKNIREVRELIREQKWCSEVRIVESETNKGLSCSVIEGITATLKTHEGIIVLEDDIVVAKGFLKFMNEALRMYAKDDKVAGVSGWSFPIQVSEHTYFSRVGSCWGWATWKRVWDKVNFNGTELIEKLEQRDLIGEFNVDGSYEYFGMLNSQVLGKVDSWAVRFYANYFLTNSLFLFPKYSLAHNIGFDGSGTHSSNIEEDVPVVFKRSVLKLKYIRTKEENNTRMNIVRYFQMPHKPLGIFHRIALKIRKKFL